MRVFFKGGIGMRPVLCSEHSGRERDDFMAHEEEGTLLYLSIYIGYIFIFTCRRSPASRMGTRGTLPSAWRCPVTSRWVKDKKNEWLVKKERPHSKV